MGEGTATPAGCRQPKLDGDELAMGRGDAVQQGPGDECDGPPRRSNGTKQAATSPEGETGESVAMKDEAGAMTGDR